MAGAAVAVIALLIVWNRPEMAPNQQIAVAVPQPQPSGKESRGRIVTPPPTAGAPAPRVARTRGAQPARALEPIDPLVIEPMTMPLMAVAASPGLMPIEMDDLQIDPLQIE